MANLAHRASQFMDKKFLIIHPTADGRTRIFKTKTVCKSHMKQKDVLPLTFWRISHYVSPEKVHFQHTAKFIAQLINEKANYTLQVCGFNFAPL